MLDRFAALSNVPADEIALAKAEPVPTAAARCRCSRRTRPIGRSPKLRRAAKSGSRIDADLQKNLEELARERVRTLALTLGPDISLAMLVVDNATGEVLARVGSPDYFDERRAGQVDMTQALRSPGSTLKPFIYGLGFEDGFIHPETLIEDRPVRYGAYAPQNFDFTFQGTVSVRKALQLSLNVPAIAVLDRVGAQAARGALDAGRRHARAAGGRGPGPCRGSRRRRHQACRPGEALCGDCAAWHCVAAARAHGRQGEAQSTPGAGRGLVRQQCAARHAAAGEWRAGRIAFKTGTSYGYRDAWSIGFDGKHTIGVWVGRPDGAPVPGLVGRSAAAPILFDAFARLPTPPAALPRAPAGVLVTTSAKLPPPLKRFQPGDRAGAATPARLHILFPPDGARLELRTTDNKPDPVPLKVTAAVAPLTVLVNGIPARDQPRGSLFFQPAGPGFARVTVIDASGAADSVVVRVEDAASAMSAVQAAAAACRGHALRPSLTHPSLTQTFSLWSARILYARERHEHEQRDDTSLQSVGMP